MAYKDIEDQRKANRDHYKNNKEYYKEKRRRRSHEISAWLEEYKSTLSCIQCGESHSACLVFHHRDPDDKEVDIGRVASQGWSIKRIQKEIDKWLRTTR